MFTLENTEGFNESEIELMNSAVMKLMRLNPDLPEETLIEVVKNLWTRVSH